MNGAIGIPAGQPVYLELFWCLPFRDGLGHCCDAMQWMVFLIEKNDIRSGRRFKLPGFGAPFPR